MNHRAVFRPRAASRLVLVLLALAVAVSACSGGTSDDTTTTVAETTTTIRDQPVDASSFFAINEIGLGSNGYVSLTNFTDVPVRLAGLVLVQGSDYFELPDVAVEPDGTVRVAVGDGEGLENVVATDATLGELAPEDGEIALFTSQEFDDPTAIIVYLEWGSTPHELNPVAVEAGLWLEGSFAPTAATATRLFRVEESGLWIFEPNN